MRRLTDSSYMAFPLRISGNGVETSGRGEHVREQIEQVLFTTPGERVFRPEFGAGVRRLIFEPNNNALWSMTRKHLNASLAKALFGEVDPKTLDVQVEADGEQLLITISYTLAAIGQIETHSISVGVGE